MSEDTIECDSWHHVSCSWFIYEDSYDEQKNISIFIYCLFNTFVNYILLKHDKSRLGAVTLEHM